MTETAIRNAAETTAPVRGVPGAQAGDPVEAASRRLITRSGLQIALGAIWLLDGLLQLQGYMYSHAFVSQVLEASAQGQPSFVGGPILTMAHLYGRDLALWNTLAAVIQCAIGAGLLIGGRVLKPALAVSFGWALAVWWFGEGFGMLPTGAPVSPLMGAPGAALLYLLVGLLVWPGRSRPHPTVATGSLVGDRGGRLMWTLVWLGAAMLWLLSENRAAEAIHDQLTGMAAGSPHPLAEWQRSVADATQGHGGSVAVVLALVSVAIAAGVWLPRLRVASALAGVLLALVFWVLGQSLGGPFWAGDATDLNSGPLLVLLALTLMPLRAPRERLAPRRASYFPGGVRARAGTYTMIAVTTLGLLLLAFPSAFTFSTGAGVGSPALGAMAGMDMDMSPTAGVQPAVGGPCTEARCPIADPARDELSVAGELGRAVAALWVKPAARGLQARLELLNANMGPVKDGVRIAGSSAREMCGPGCWTFRLAAGSESVAISTEQQGRSYSLSLPVRWKQGQSALARQLVRRAVASMQALRGVRDEQTLTSGPPGVIERIDYRLGSPDRMSYSMNTGPRVVVIGGSEWASMRGRDWRKSVYGGGASGGFHTSSWYDWAAYDQSAQLLDERVSDGRLVADVALMDPALPVWFELHLEVGSGLVSSAGMIAGGHFMSDRYSEYGRAQRILAPSGDR